jgi:hypothetical protein
MVRVYKSNSQYCEAEMQEAKKIVLQEVSPRTVLLLCFVYHINTAVASGSDKNED